MQMNPRNMWRFIVLARPRRVFQTEKRVWPRVPLPHKGSTTSLYTFLNRIVDRMMDAHYATGKAHQTAPTPPSCARIYATGIRTTS